MYTTPCNGVISHGAQIGGIWVFADHTCGHKHKQNASTIFARRLGFYVCLSSCSNCSTYLSWGIMVILIARKTRIPPIWAPCRDKNGADSGISLVHLCFTSKWLTPALMALPTWFRKSNAGFRLTCRLPHCRFDDDIYSTAQAPLAAEGWPSGKQRQAKRSITLPLCPPRQIADSWILFNSGAMPLGDRAKAALQLWNSKRWSRGIAAKQRAAS